MQKCRGFTLVELLVSMVVLALVMVLTVQMVGRTTAITSASNQQMNTASLARVALDRIGADLGGAALTGGATMLYYSGSTGATIDPSLDSAIGFVCKSRARRPSDFATNVSVQDVRGIVVGYKIRPAPLTLPAQATVDLPMISRGDAVYTFLTDGASAGDKYGFSIWNLFGINGSKQLPTDLTMAGGSSDTTLLDWQGFGDGILRFHITFVLDDGRIVQSLQQTAGSPPLDATYRNFQSNGGTGNCLPIAFSADTSADSNKRYVKGLIVGIAVLDQTTLAGNYLQNHSFVSNLAAQLKRPTKDGEIPLQIWQANLPQLTPPPVRQSIRFYQRFYSINL